MTDSELDFHRYLRLFKKHKKLFFSAALSVMAIAVLISYLLPKRYEATSTVFIEKSVVADLVKGIAGPSSEDNSLKVIDYALTSRTLLLKAMNSVDFNPRPQNDAEIEMLLDEIRTHIDINKNGQSPNVFIVSFRYPNPKVARDFVNTLVQLFIEQNVSSKREESFGANKFLADQIATYKERRDKAQSMVNEFKESRGTVASVDSGQLQHDIEIEQQRLAELGLREKQLEEEKSYAVNSTNPLKVKLAALTKRLDDLRAQFTDNYPEVIHVKSEIASLQQQIDGGKTGHGNVLVPEELWKIEAELKAIKENKVLLQQLIAGNKSMLNSIPNTKAVIEKLESEKTNEQNMYNLLAMRQDQSEISNQMELQDKSTVFRIVDPAVTPIAPVSPNRKRIILMGIAAGLATGFGLLLAFDYVDHSVKTVGMLKTLGFPVLAVIPLIKSEEEIRREKTNDFRIYLWSAGFFSLILAVLALEVLGVTFMDVLINRLPLPSAVIRFFERL
ncbi:MAG: Wzz/FepE/Etk N-terminal domain-containing protein [Nitrospiraceae bacterium]|nr:Wzz/FepE/Etk N-terminal domain-containing protein [Nitrospiraceae bacterium]